MNRLWLAVFLLLLLSGACVSGAAPTPTATPIASPTPGPTSTPRSVFERYRSALLAADGYAAAEAVDRGTIKWYDEVVNGALTLSRPDLDRLSFTRKFAVLRLRHYFRLRELEAMTGEKLFVFAVEQGWISRPGTAEAELAQVHIEGDRAWASLQPAPEVPACFFIMENGEWKLALWEAFPLVNQQLEQSVAESGLSEDEYSIQMLQTLSGTEVDESIFEGPLE